MEAFTAADTLTPVFKIPPTEGSVFIAGFGCPPARHADDPVRSVHAALEFKSSLELMKMPCRIGVATGRVFVGDVGKGIQWKIV
jgi:class 3 adenylate cyclase